MLKTVMSGWLHIPWIMAIVNTAQLHRRELAGSAPVTEEDPFDEVTRATMYLAAWGW